MLAYKKLSNDAFPLKRATKYSAGFDISSPLNCAVPAQGKILIYSDLVLCIPDEHYGRIAGRSGLAANHFISVGRGVIDRDYTGNVGVILFNHSNKDYEVKRGDRIAQLIIEKCSYDSAQEVSDITRPDCCERNCNGFGSSGK